MSAFLGKIHYLLYNKIQVHEKFIDSIVELSKSKGYDSDSLLNESYSRFGFPATGELSDVIEHSNIHGWLQERIKSVESRLAYVVTELLSKNIVTKEELSCIFYEDGESKMKELDLGESSPQDMFKLIFDYMIEGMPCDRVNEIIENSENIVKWKTVVDIHKNYWDDAQGEVSNFYYLRDSWINGFLSACATKYKYTRTENVINTIERV
ncbi:hypothetical protein H2684_09445 [Clostridium sp. cel8]|jgi:hypothetical protein|uniref:hypothetical protein n=1 Tax=unclassified Clostridium TaxID=2614128 RepID=UPI0015F39F9C|nr:hypothetical protein [Clostridium sp. cel8]MBA5851526.1 hypothetical protein [Clostridium sp. cel8]